MPLEFVWGVKCNVRRNVEVVCRKTCTKRVKILLRLPALDASRQAKKDPTKSSRDENESTCRRGEGGEEPA